MSEQIDKEQSATAEFEALLKQIYRNKVINRFIGATLLVFSFGTVFLLGDFYSQQTNTESACLKTLEIVKQTAHTHPADSAVRGE